MKKKRSDNLLNPRKTQKVFFRFEREMARLGKRQFRFMKAAYKEKLIPQIKPLYSLSFDADEMEIDRLKRLLEQISNGAIDDFTRKELNGKLQKIMQGLDEESMRMIDQVTGEKRKAVQTIMNKEIRGVIDRRSKEIMNDYKLSGEITSRRLEQRITSGLVAGERHESIAKGLRSLLSDGNEEGSAVRRARFIARNAVSSTLGEINKERQTSLGIELYRWQTAEDERVRPTHEELNGGTFSWDGTVKVDGKTYKPAVDPQFSNGPVIPGQPWNCFPASTRLPFLNGIRKIYRSHFTGMLTKAVFDEGELLATPNHPVLTPHGFVAIQDLKKGDKVLAISQDSLNGSEQNVDRIDTTFGELFESLNFPEIFDSGRIAEVGFYGDIAKNEKVDVITLDRLLPNEVQARISEELKELFFSKADMSTRFFASISARNEAFFSSFTSTFSLIRLSYNILSFLRTAAFKTDEISLRYISEINSISLEVFGQRFSFEPMALRYSLDGVPREVFIDNTRRYWFSIMRNEISIPLDPTGSQKMAEGFSSPTVLRSYLTEALPFGVFTEYTVNNIVGPSVFHDAPIYTLETSSGIYIAEKTVVANCRCVALAYIPELEE